MIASETADKIVTEWLAEVARNDDMNWDDLADLKARIAKAMSGQWVTISERLPEVDEPRKLYAGFWVYRPGSNAGTMWETMHPSWWNQEGLDDGCQITHWLDWQPPETPE